MQKIQSTAPLQGNPRVAEHSHSLHENNQQQSTSTAKPVVHTVDNKNKKRITKHSKTQSEQSSSTSEKILKHRTIAQSDSSSTKEHTQKKYAKQKTMHIHERLHETIYLDEEEMLEECATSEDESDYSTDGDAPQTIEEFNRKLEATMKTLYTPSSRALLRAEYEKYNPPQEIHIIPKVTYNSPFSITRVLLTGLQLGAEITRIYQTIETETDAVKTAYARYKYYASRHKEYQDLNVQEQEVVTSISDFLFTLQSILTKEGIPHQDKTIATELYSRLTHHMNIFIELSDERETLTQKERTFLIKKEKDTINTLLSHGIVKKYKDICSQQRTQSDTVSDTQNDSIPEDTTIPQQESISNYKDTSTLDLSSTPVIEDARTKNIPHSTANTQDKTFLEKIQNTQQKTSFSSFFSEAFPIPSKLGSDNKDTEYSLEDNVSSTRDIPALHTPSEADTEENSLHSRTKRGLDDGMEESIDITTRLQQIIRKNPSLQDAFNKVIDFIKNNKQITDIKKLMSHRRFKTLLSTLVDEIENDMNVVGKTKAYSDDMSIEIEMFSDLDFQSNKANSIYQQAHDAAFTDENAVIPQSFFILGYSMRDRDYRRNIALYLALSILPKELLTQQEMGMLSAFIKKGKNLYARQQLSLINSAREKFIEGIEQKSKQGLLGHTLDNEPILSLSSAKDLSNAELYPINEKRGLCFLLSSTYLTLCNKYGEEEGSIRFREIISSIGVINMLPPKEKVPYYIAIASMHNDLQTAYINSQLQKDLQDSDIVDISLRDKNKQKSLTKTEVHTLLFSTDFAPDKKLFLLESSDHVIAITRKIEEDPITKEKKVAVTMMDTSIGLVHTDSETILKEVSQYLKDDQADYTLLEATPEEFEKLYSVSDVLLIDFMENRIINNPRMQKELLFQSEFYNKRYEHKIALQQPSFSRDLYIYITSLASTLSELQYLAKENGIILKNFYFPDGTLVTEAIFKNILEKLHVQNLDKDDVDAIAKDIKYLVKDIEVAIKDIDISQKRVTDVQKECLQTIETLKTLILALGSKSTFNTHAQEIDIIKKQLSALSTNLERYDILVKEYSFSFPVIELSNKQVLTPEYIHSLYATLESLQGRAKIQYNSIDTDITKIIEAIKPYLKDIKQLYKNKNDAEKQIFKKLHIECLNLLRALSHSNIEWKMFWGKEESESISKDINNKLTAIVTVLDELQKITIHDSIQIPPVKIHHGEIPILNGIENLQKDITKLYANNQELFVTINTIQEISTHLTPILKTPPSIPQTQVKGIEHPITKAQKACLVSIKNLNDSIEKNTLVLGQANPIQNIAVLAPQQVPKKPINSAESILLKETKFEGKVQAPTEPYYLISSMDVEESTTPSSVQIFSEKDLKRLGVLDSDETVIIKHMTMNLMRELDTLIEIAGLDRNLYIAPEITLATLFSTKVSELDALQKEHIELINIKTKERVSIPIKDSSFSHNAKLFHSKMISLQKRADIAFKGYAGFSSVMTLVNARDTIELGSTLDKFTTLGKIDYLMGTVDSGADTLTNFAGAINKVTKRAFHAINGLSKTSRILGGISAGVGAVASSANFITSLLEYGYEPNKVNEVCLIFDGIDLLLGGITLAYPPAALISIPASLLLSFIKDIVLKQVIEEIRDKEMISRLTSFIEDLEQYAHMIQKDSFIDFHNGIAYFRINNGDIIKLSIEADNKIVVSFSSYTGKGVRVHDTRTWKLNEEFIPLRTEKTPKASLERSALFPRKICLRKNYFHNQKFCAMEQGKLTGSSRLSWLTDSTPAEYCDLFPNLKGTYYESIYSKKPPISLQEIKNDVPSAIASQVVFSDTPIQGLQLPEQFQTVQEVKEYPFSYNVIYNAKYYQNLYRNKHTAHALAKCTAFDAIRPSAMDYILKDKDILMEYTATYLGNRCYVVNRREMEIDFSSTTETPFVLLPHNSETSEYSTSKRIEEETGCSIDKEASIPAYNTYTITASAYKIIPIVLSGKNKLVLKAPVINNEKMQINGGFLLHAEDITKESAGKHSKPSITIVEAPTPKIYITSSEGNIIVDLAYVDASTPLYIRTATGFLLEYNHNRKQFIPIVYDYTIKPYESKERINQIDSDFGRGGANLIRHKLEKGTLLPKTLSNGSQAPCFHIEAPFEVRGIITGDEYADNPVIRTGVYMPKPQNEDMLYALKIGNFRESVILSSIDFPSYKLVHVDRDLNDYKDMISLYNIYNPKNLYVSYFYSPTDKKVLVQLGEYPITELSIFPALSEPKLHQFSNGESRLILNGYTTLYDNHGYPIEIVIRFNETVDTMEKIDANIQKFVENIQVGQSISFEDDRKILLQDIEYITKTGTKHTINGRVHIHNGLLSLNIPELQGKKVKQLLTPSSPKNTYSYYLMEDSTEDEKKEIRIFALKLQQSLAEQKDTSGTGHIHEEALPKPIFLLEDIANIQHVFAIEEKLFIKTEDGVVFCVEVDNVEINTKLVSLSENFFEQFNVDMSNPEQILQTTRFASIYYGTPEVKTVPIIQHTTANEERVSIAKFVVDIEENIIAETLTEEFEHIVSKRNLEKIITKRKRTRKTRNVQEKDISKKEELNLRDYAPLRPLQDLGRKRTIAFGWNKKTDTLMMSSVMEKQRKFVETYKFDKFEITSQGAIVRFGMEEERKQSRRKHTGLILSEAKTILFEPSRDNSIQLEYVEEDLLFINEIILEQGDSKEYLPSILLNTAEKRELTSSRVRKKDVRVRKSKINDDLVIQVPRSYVKYGTAKPYTLVRLRDFFRYSLQENPYSGKIILNNQNLLAEDIIKILDIQE